MKFKIKRFVLTVLLEKAAMALMTASKDAAPTLRGFQIEATKDSLRVMSTDLSMAVIAETGLVEVLEIGQAVLPGQKLVEIAREAEDVEGTITVSEDVVEIIFGKASWTTKLVVGDYPELPTVEGVEFHHVPREEFAKALDRVYLAISGTSVRPEQMLVHVSEGKVIAADGPRYHAVDFACPIDIDIPGASVPYLVRQLRKGEEDAIRIGDTEQYLLFLIKDDLFVITKSAGEAPDYSAYERLTVDNNEEFSFDRKDMESAVRRVRINADPDTAQIYLKLVNPDAGILLARDKFGNLATHDLELYWRNDSRLVSVNWKYLEDLLKAADAGTIRISVGKDRSNRRSMLLVREEDFTGVINQLRVDPNEAQEIMG